MAVNFYLLDIKKTTEPPKRLHLSSADPENFSGGGGGVRRIIVLRIF